MGEKRKTLNYFHLRAAAIISSKAVERLVCPSSSTMAPQSVASNWREFLWNFAERSILLDIPIIFDFAQFSRRSTVRP